jgi:hypothetical protein
MTDESNDAPAPTSKGFHWGWLVWPGLVLFLYVLSIGPIMMMVQRGRITTGSPTHEVLRAIYEPLVWTVEKVPLLDKTLSIYLHLWIPERVDSKGKWK